MNFLLISTLTHIQTTQRHILTRTDSHAPLGSRNLWLHRAHLATYAKLILNLTIDSYATNHSF